MEIFTIGSAQNYAKSRALLQKWELKKVDAKGAERLFGTPSLDEEKVERQLEEIKAARIGNLDTKLRLGQCLSSQELDFLREHSPQLYKRAILVAEERKAYEEELRRCRTKDEVQEANSRRITMLASMAYSAKGTSGSYMPVMAADASARIGAVQREHERFVQGSRYKKLPWRYEKKKKTKELEQTVKNTRIKDLRA